MTDGTMSAAPVEVAAPDPVAEPHELAQQPALARRAVIFVSGAGDPGDDKSVATVAEKLAAALDADAQPGTAYEVGEAQPVAYGVEWKTDVVTVRRTHDGYPVAELDVFAFRVSDVLTQSYRARGTIARAFLSLMLLVLYMPVLGKLVGGRRGVRFLRDGFRYRFQIGVAAYVLALQGVYVLLLAYAAAATALPQLSGLWAERLPQAAVLAATAVGLSRPRVVAALSDAAVTAAAIVFYLRSGYRRDVLTGRFLTLLRRVQARGYDGVDVIAYSFGGIVVLDALAPRDGLAPRSAVDSVGSLVTIGVPAATVRSYFADYFDGRAKPPSLRWTNVWSQRDVLASSFGGDDGAEPLSEAWPAPDESICFGSAGATRAADMLLALGLREHGTYWGPRGLGERNAFEALAPRLFAGSPLATPIEGAP